MAASRVRQEEKAARDYGLHGASGRGSGATATIAASPKATNTKGPGRAMLIAQITDIHLGFDPDNPAEFNRKRLD